MQKKLPMHVGRVVYFTRPSEFGIIEDNNGGHWYFNKISWVGERRINVGVVVDFEDPGSVDKRAIHLRHRTNHYHRLIRRKTPT